jgi:hypothetical protein
VSREILNLINPDFSDDTRCQRVDDRLTLVELDSLIADLEASLISEDSLLDKLKVMVLINGQ